MAKYYYKDEQKISIGCAGLNLAELYLLDDDGENIEVFFCQYDRNADSIFDVQSAAMKNCYRQAKAAGYNVNI